MSKADVMRQMTLADACNAVARLEKENAELKDVIEGYKKIVKWCDKCDKLADLEEENAELKDDNKVMADNYSKMEQKFYDNLAKAKEIIKLLLWDLRNRSYEPVKDVERAEQFLKENSTYECIQKAKYNYID